MRAPPETVLDPVELLTPRERDCLRLVDRHLSSKQIARELGMSKASVDTYCDRARRKLGVGDRYAAARALADHEIAVPIGSGHDAIRTDADPVSWADEAQQGDRADGRLVARTGGRQRGGGGPAPDPRNDEPPGGGGPGDAGAGRGGRVRAPLAGAAEPRGPGPELYLEPARAAARGFGGFADEGGHGPRPDLWLAENVAVQAAGNGVAGNPLHQLGAVGRGLPTGAGPGLSARGLSPLARLGLVGVIAIIAALAFGALLAGLHALQSLI
ncbi:MAG: LuxR family transcriptional regulator [Phenylobacterium sp.]|nr:LuxR family transcriptional regulator [Phenylobacterium sp.]